MADKEFQFIKERVKEKEAYEEVKKPEELIVKETIGERMEEALKNLPPPVESPASSLPISAIPLSTSQDENFEKKVKELVNIAFEKNIPYAVNLARKSSNYPLLDALHDALVKYYIEKSTEEKL